MESVHFSAEIYLFFSYNRNSITGIAIGNALHLKYAIGNVLASSLMIVFLGFFYVSSTFLEGQMILENNIGYEISRYY